jgi:CubicO group peptidase (beta-lactamase class C family)
MRLLRKPMRRLVTGCVAIGAAIAVTFGIGPRPPSMGYAAAGDARLVTEVRSLVAGPESRSAGAEPGFRSLAVGLVDAGRVSFAFLGSAAEDPSTRYELASITKTFTAALLADAVDRSVVNLDDRLDRHLPELAGTPAGGVTLEELATHRSGLPAYADPVSGAVYEGVGTADLAAEGVAEVIAQAARLNLTGRGTMQYSNLGVALLGFAMARAENEVSWEMLVQRRILDPLGMAATTFAANEAEVPGHVAAGHRVNGTPVGPVVGAGYLPAGTSTFTTVADMTRYASALLDGTVVGGWAMDPRRGDPGEPRIGLAWFTADHAGHEVQWHAGGVPGYASVLIVDRTTKRAVVVLGASEQAVDALGFHLLDPDSDVSWFGATRPALLLGLLGGGLLLLASVVAVRSRRRSMLLAAGVVAQAGLLVLLRHGPWHQLPSWAWGSAAAWVFWLTLRAGVRWNTFAGSVLPDKGREAIAPGLAAAAYVAAVWLG